MSAPCPPNVPPYYLNITHSIAAISAPINTFALYLLLFRSPNIGNYKYCIFYLLLAASLTELQMTIVCPGYYFFPIMAGFNTSNFFGSLLRSHIYFSIYTFFLCSEVPAIVLCFICRHNSVMSIRSGQPTSRVAKNSVFAASVLFPFGAGLSIYMAELTDEEAFLYLSKSYPQCLHWLQSKFFTVYDYHTNIWFVGSEASQYSFGLGAHTLWLLQKLRCHMSPSTYRIHRGAVINLGLQVIIPSIFLVLPLYVCLYVIAFELVEHQEMAVNMTVLISCHSGCSSIVMICANPRYRSEVGHLFCSVFKSENSRIEPRVHIEPNSACR